MFKVRSRPATTPIAQVTPLELQQRLQAQEPMLLLDVRTPAEFAHDGHIPGTRLLPLAAMPARSHELPRDTPLVCVCRSGARSQVACEMLRRQGFTRLINLRGGVLAWRQAGLPLS